MVYKLLRPSHNAQVCLTKTSFLLLKSKKTIIFTADKVEYVMTVGFLRPRIQVGITPVTRRQSFKKPIHENWYQPTQQPAKHIT